jgi:hypothetical protein
VPAPWPFEAVDALGGFALDVPAADEAPEVSAEPVVGGGVAGVAAGCSVAAAAGAAAEVLALGWTLASGG